MSQKHIPLSFENELIKRLKEKDMLMQFILGPRQVGKTTGVEQVIRKYKGPVHYVLAEKNEAKKTDWLVKEWWYALSIEKNPLLVIDEIQKIENWSETLKFLWDQTKTQKKKLKCIFLGSSSLELSSGLSESLSGRFELINVPHWNFFLSKKLLPTFSLEGFLKFGGYPGSYKFLKSKSRWRKYITESVVETVITKDILAFKTVKKPALFRQLIDILAAYPAQDISYTKLLGQIQESGNVEIVKYYLSLLQSAFLFTSIEKYHSKKVLQKASSPKVIPMCPAIIEALAPETPIGRRFEAYIGSLLIGLNGNLFYWRDGDYEVDFIYKNTQGKIFAIEVKSGKSKHSASLKTFLEKHPKIQPIIIDQNNFSKLQEFIEEEN